MFSSRFGLLARGFISGAVVTASISYSLFMTEKAEVPLKSSDINPERFPFGKPVDMRQTIDYTGHTLYYDAAKKQALWVSELLTKDSLSGKANRKYCKFRRDVQVPEEFSAENADYLKSGWTRGHMAPAGNCKFSQQAMDDTFYLTNIVPQDGDNNSGFWNRFENFCRGLTQKFEKVLVITGPLYVDSTDPSGKSFIHYEVIGNDKIPAPTHLYKVIVAYNSLNDEPVLGAFVVPNAPIAKDVRELTKYQVSIDDLQVRTGFTFHPNLARDKTTDLCAAGKNACRLESWKDLPMYLARKKIKYASSQQDIDKAVANLHKNNIKPDERLLTEINEKRGQLQNHPSDTLRRDSRKA